MSNTEELVELEIFCVCGEKIDGYVTEDGAKIVAYQCPKCTKNKPNDFGKSALQEDARRNDPNDSFMRWKY